MKKQIAFILAATLACASGCGSKEASAQSDAAVSAAALSYTAEAEYNSIFQGDKIIDIKITLPQEDFQDMLNNAEAEEYKQADVIVDGTEVKNAGFRVKGNLTLRSVAGSDSDRYSFRIKLDKYVKGQTLKGLDELVINNMYSDYSYMREYLSYEALRSIGVDTPQCVFANIYVNDELKGLYLCVEAIDDSYVERVYGNTEGNLYKAEMGSSLVYKEDSSYESLELKIGSDEAKTGLKNMISALNSIENGDKGNIEQVLDVDSALKYIAFNYVFSNYDSYLGHTQQNYYLYENNGIFSVIPWDYNMALSNNMAEGGAKVEMPVSDNGNYPLVSKLLSVEEYKERYLGYVRELLDYCDGAEARISALKTVIYDAVDADPTKFCTTEDFDKATSYSETEEGQIYENMPQSRDGMKERSSSGEMPEPPDSSGEMPEPPNSSGKTPDFDRNMKGDRAFPREGDRQPPDGNMAQGGGVQPNGDMQQGKEQADNAAPQMGDRPMNGRGGMGGGMRGSSSSIVNFIKNRSAAIRAELDKV